MKNIAEQPSVFTSDTITITEGLENLAMQVVLVEDEPELRKVYSELLTILGYDIIVAGDGASALEAIRTVKPQVVICDLGLPGAIDGYALAQAVRADPEHVTTFMIALTGRPEDGGIKPALINGFDVYLRKPVEIERLAEQLQLAQAQRKYTI